ncbi:FAD/NAD(P)-binding protein [Siphonobacter curvatus]|uniref:FAD-dependent urate hydroxylase HpyO/Asp monooxygenase CreE-like FAD/NAD(P)-binding domain-containing protein n=1 Tax=Siphonobacter curvatus TaxID=2094562 RepID=A0A2S7IM38_9BACT|nr:FAD/NAD(P)-binding protein [Siphonobacter curvatus]PQA58688.1 hypothetical protein C5O19_03215 [Siphonobacter curvatus]
MNQNYRQTIAIIGAGASGTTCLIQLVLKYVVNCCTTPLRLLLFERKPEFGPGLAYGTGQEGHLLNTKAGLMGIVPGERLHFVDWMHTNKAAIEKEYLDLEISPDSYPPRMLFGSYVKAMLQEYTDLAAEHDIEIEKVQDEIIDAQLLDDDRFELKSTQGEIFLCDYAILATGNPAPSAFQEFKDLPQFLMSPWPSKKVLETIRDKEASVAIIGSSLTAIDALITLVSNEHKGKIRFFSKTGLLPRVQAAQEVPFDRKYLTLPTIRKCIREKRRALRVTDLIRLFKKEVEEHQPLKPEWSIEKRTAKDTLPLLEEDLQQAYEGSNLYQNILYDMRDDIYPIWQLLSADQKLLFLSWVKPFYDINRHSIPIKNGEKLAALLKQGQLSITGSSKDLEWDGKRFVLQMQDGSTEYADFVINASGPAVTVDEMVDQPLLKQLLGKDLIRSYEAGGIVVDLRTMQVVADQTAGNLYAIGQPLAGIQHEVNSLWFNVEQADLLTNHLLEKIS